MKVNFNVNQNIDNERVRNAVRNVLFKSMLKIHSLSKKNAPVDTGRLRNSITLQPMKPNQDSYVLTAGVNYAKFVEFGTVKTNAQPFLRPALKEVRDIWVKRFTNQTLQKQ